MSLSFPSRTALESVITQAAPAIFVVLWSTGFIGMKYALSGAEPMTLLSVRMLFTLAVLAVIIAIRRPAWPGRQGIMHSAVAGLLVHGFYLGATGIAIAHSVPAGLSALMPGLQPILTSTLANRWLGERVTPMQWIGLLVGVAGTLIVLHGRPLTGQAGWGWFATCVALVSITLGTLYQKRYCGHIDWRTGNFVQFATAGLLFAVGAFLFENRVIVWSHQFIFGVAWLAIVLSVGSVGLLYWLIRHSAATRVVSLFYLVPGVTAIMAYVLFDERLDPVSIAGMVVCAAAVMLVNRSPAASEQK